MELIELKKDSEFFSSVMNDQIDDLGFEFLSNDSYVTFSLVDKKALSSISYSLAFEDADILYIYTKKDELRKGYAYMLMNESFSKLKEKGVSNIFLEVRESNISAINLYKKCGFKEIGTRKNYYENGENAVLMKAVI